MFYAFRDNYLAMFKIKASSFSNRKYFKWIEINSELAALPENLCCIWSSTRDFRKRKFYFTCNHRYGIELRTGRKLLHVILCILLAGDVATNPGPCSFIPNSDAKYSSDLKVLYLNARSLKSFVSIDDNPTNKVCKITLLQELVHSRGSYEVICICETWLNNTVLDAKLLPEFDIFRRDRTVKAGGGVLIAVKEGLQASRRFDLERVGVELIVIQLSKANNKPVIIYVYYRPPGFCSDGLILLNNSLLSNQESNCIVLVGDFNLPSISWSDNHSTPVNSGCADGELLCELIGDNFLEQFVEGREQFVDTNSPP